MGRLVKLRDAVQVIPASAPRPLGLKPAFLGMSVCRPPSGVILSRRGSAPFCHPPAGTQPDPINLLDQAGLSPRPDHPPIRHADAKGEIAALAFAVEALALLRQRREHRGQARSSMMSRPVHRSGLHQGFGRTGRYEVAGSRADRPQRRRDPGWSDWTITSTS
jgi:hypothetical protein